MLGSEVKKIMNTELDTVDHMSRRWNEELLQSLCKKYHSTQDIQTCIFIVPAAQCNNRPSWSTVVS